MSILGNNPVERGHDYFYQFCTTQRGTEQYKFFLTSAFQAIHDIPLIGSPDFVFVAELRDVNPITQLVNARHRHIHNIARQVILPQGPGITASQEEIQSDVREYFLHLYGENRLSRLAAQFEAAKTGKLLSRAGELEQQREELIKKNKTVFSSIYPRYSVFLL